jgi:hypothetical protein
MNVVELIVMVCSLLNPQACSEKRFVFEASGSLKSCMMQAQPYLAQWAGDHPDERIASFHCAWPGQERESL